MTVTNLYVKTIGNGKPLILLHGWGWNSLIWEDIATQLAEANQVYLIDLPGCGKSANLAKEYNFKNILELIFSHVPDNATWCGWSLGGLLTLYGACHYPEKVSRIITIAASPCFIQQSGWPGLSAITLHKFGRALCERFDETLLEFLTLQLRGSKDSKDLFIKLKETLLCNNRPDLSALAGGLELLRSTDLRKPFSTLQCKALHIFGSLDTIVPARITQTNLYADKNSNVIPRCGHIPFLSKRQEFLALIKLWLNNTN